MSTYLYLVCDSHTPPLRADDESGQHTSDLPQIQADLANRYLLARAANIGVIPDEYFRGSTSRFLQRHPSCTVGIIDEYGKRYPINDALEATR